MSNDLIKRYNDTQLEASEACKAHFLQHGKITSFRDLYPDIIVPDGGIAYSRGLTPLTFLLLMYERVALFVPPCSERILESRYGLPLAAIEHLCEAEVIQPIISNPLDYTSPHLERFLRLRAPSVWSRGVYALQVLDMGWSLDKDQCPLPIDDMAQSPTLISRFSTRYPDLRDDDLAQRIIADILVNYADLCIFGHKDLAARLIDYKDPRKIVEVLYLVSEILTYPHLFGLGGTANYDEISTRLDPEYIPLNVDLFGTVDLPLDSYELDVFVRGINLKIQSLSARDILEFHSSGDGVRLREAVKHFEKEARAIVEYAGGTEPSPLIAAAEIMREKMLEAAKLLSSPEFIRRTRRQEKTLNILLQCGTIAAGAFIGQQIVGHPVGLLGGGAILNQVLLPVIRDNVADAVRNLLLGPGLANLWRLGKKK